MRTSPSASVSLRWAALGCLAALLASCGPSASEVAIRSGRQAESQERWFDAAQHYDRACQLGRSDYCGRGRELRAHAVDVYTFEAESHCKADRLDECLAVVRRLQGVDAGDRQRIVHVLTLASELAQRMCRAQQTDLPSLLAQAGCLQSYQGDLSSVTSFASTYAAAMRRVQSGFLDAANNEASKPARAIFLDAAACFGPLSPSLLDQRQKAATDFAAEMSAQLQLTWQGHDGATQQGLCRKAAELVGRGLRCQQGVRPAIEAVVAPMSFRPTWEHTFSDRFERVQYVAGTERVPNPAHDSARVEYELADRRLAEAEREARELTRECSRSGEDADCQEAERAEDRVDDRRLDRDNARSRFQNEPSYIERDVVREHEYRIRTHEWSAPFQAQLRLGDEPAQTLQFNVSYSDAEQDGFPPAGIPSDPLTPPSRDLYPTRTHSWMMEQLTGRLAMELARQGEAMAADCREPVASCWARRRFLLGEQTGFGPAFAREAAQTAGRAPSPGGISCAGEYSPLTIR